MKTGSLELYWWLICFSKCFERKISRHHNSLCNVVYIWTDLFESVFMDLVIFLDVPFSIEPMFSEWTQVGVCLVIFTVIGALEQMWTWFTFFCFKARRIGFLIYFTAPPELTMVFRLVRAIALDTLKVLNSARHSCMSPSPAVFTLRDTRVHVSFSNGGNILPHIKTPINKALSLTLTLNIPYINPNDWHVRLWWHFDNSWFWSENNVVENLVLFNDAFHITGWKMFIRFVMGEVGYAYDFQVGLRLRKSRDSYIDGIDIINFLYVVCDDVEVRLYRDLVGDHRDASQVRMDEVN